MKSLNSFIRRADLLGYKHSTSFKGDLSHRSCCGGMVTLVMFSVFALGFVYFGKEIFERKNPIVFKSEKVAGESTFPLRNIGMYFFFADSTGKILNLDPNFMRSIKMQAFMLNYQIENNMPKMGFEPLFVEPCREDFFLPSQLSQVNATLAVSSFLCINPEKVVREGKVVKTELEVKNEQNMVGANTIWFNIRTCDEQVDPGCSAWLDKYQDFFIMTQFTDSFFQADNYHDPIQSKMKGINTLVGKHLNFLEKLSFSNTEVLLDAGYVFENLEVNSFVAFSDKEMTLQLFEPDNPNLYDMHIQCLQKTSTISRKYTKMQQIVADVGGFAKALLLFVGLFTRTIGEFLFLKELNGYYTAEKGQNTVRHVSFNLSNNASTAGIRTMKKKRPDANLDFGTFILTYFAPNIAKKRGFDKKIVLKIFDADWIYREIEDLKDQLEKCLEVS